MVEGRLNNAGTYQRQFVTPLDGRHFFFRWAIDQQPSSTFDSVVSSRGRREKRYFAGEMGNGGSTCGVRREEGEEEEEDMGREEWRGLSGIIRRERECGRSERRVARWDPFQEASERMGRQLFSATGYGTSGVLSITGYDTGTGCTSAVWLAPTPTPRPLHGSCGGPGVRCTVILGGRFSGPGSVSKRPTLPV